MVQPACGQVPASALVAVESGVHRGRTYTIYLETVTARQYLAAKAEHPSLLLAPPLGGYRSYQDQANLRANPAAWGSTLASRQIQDPATGTWTHGWGTCTDIILGEANDWFLANGDRFGFLRKSPAGETNHYEQQHPTWATTTAADTTITTIDSDEEDTMATGKNVGIYYQDGSMLHGAIFNPLSGFWAEYKVTELTQIDNALAAAFETGSYALVGEGFFTNTKAACAEIRAKK